MLGTLDLLDKALKIKPANQWAKQLGITRSAFSKAKERGRVSPSLTHALATDIGADPIYWTAIAATEAEPEGPLKQRMKKALIRSNL